MKKTLRKVSAVALTAAMVASMTACGGSSTTETTKAAETTAAAAEATGEKIKLTLCIGRKNDLSFQQSAYEGSMMVEEQLGDKYEVTVVEMGDDTTKWQAAFYDAADSGADIIVGTGYQNKENFETIPLEYPDT